ncbi:hypothetical protein SprV_0401566400 [Sparganum proliferum]
MLRTPPPSDQHLLPPSDAEEGKMDAPPIVALAAVGLRSRLEARSTGRTGDQGDLRCWLLDGSEVPTVTSQKPTGKRSQGKLDTVLLNLPAHCIDFSNQLVERLEEMKAPNDKAIVETVLWIAEHNPLHLIDVPGRARRQRNATTANK